MTAITDYFGKSSIPTAYAVATTVKTTRNSGVSVLEAIDMSKYAQDTPIYFVTYKKTTDPVTGIVSVTNLISWKGLVNVSANTITNLTLAPGYTDTGNAVGDFIECIPTSYWENSLMDGIFVGHNPDGTFKKSALQAALGNDGQLVSSLDDVTSDFVLTGGVWSILSGLNASMTAATAYVDGYKNTTASVASRAFTLSKDTYVDILRDITTNAFSLVYTEVGNGVATPALAANSIRLAKVVTSASAITSVVQFGNDGTGTVFRNLGSLSQKQIFNPSKFMVYLNSAATITSGGWRLAKYDTVEFDTNRDFNTTTSQFVAPYNGYYRFSAVVAISAMPINQMTATGITVNGLGANPTKVGPEGAVGGSNNTAAGIISVSLKLNAGDTVQPCGYNNSGGTLGFVSGSNFMWFCGELISIS